jgi:hypothetical protein
MVGLLTMIFSTLGATGMGSLLKILGGLFDRMAAASETRAKRELLDYIEKSKLSVEWQGAVFGNDESGRFARGTRRIIALIGMCNFAVISILCTLWPGAELTTFKLPEHRSNFELLWGLIRLPMDAGEPTVVITTGHLALTAMVTLGAIVGFYFTPGGRK